MESTQNRNARHKSRSMEMAFAWHFIFTFVLAFALDVHFWGKFDSDVHLFDEWSHCYTVRMSIINL